MRLRERDGETWPRATRWKQCVVADFVVVVVVVAVVAVVAVVVVPKKLPRGQAQVLDSSTYSDPGIGSTGSIGSTVSDAS